jgi:hypothetical protein
MLGVDTLDRCIRELSNRRRQLYTEMFDHQDQLQIRRKFKSIHIEPAQEEVEVVLMIEGVCWVEERRIQTYIAHMRLQIDLMKAFAVFEAALLPVLNSDIIKKIWSEVEASCLKEERDKMEEIDQEFEDTWRDRHPHLYFHTEEEKENHLHWLACKEPRKYWRAWYLQMAYGDDARHFDLDTLYN